MKSYFNHIKSKTPHHRRLHATQVAGLFTALAFVVWITTLGFRFSGTAPVATADGSDLSNVNQTQLAGVAGSSDGQSGIEVVGTTTSDDSNSNSAFSNY